MNNNQNIINYTN